MLLAKNTASSRTARKSQNLIIALAVVVWVAIQTAKAWLWLREKTRL